MNNYIINFIQWIMNTFCVMHSYRTRKQLYVKRFDDPEQPSQPRTLIKNKSCIINNNKTNTRNVDHEYENKSYVNDVWCIDQELPNPTDSYESIEKTVSSPSQNKMRMIILDDNLCVFARDINDTWHVYQMVRAEGSVVAHHFGNQKQGHIRSLIDPNMSSNCLRYMYDSNVYGRK